MKFIIHSGLIACFYCYSRALARVAILSNRTAVFPPLRANLSWVVPSWERFKLPLHTEGGSARYICYGIGSWDDVKCLWVGYLYYDCQKSRAPLGWPGGLLPIEFDHYRVLVNASSGPGGVKSEALVALPKDAGGGLPDGRIQNITLTADKVCMIV